MSSERHRIICLFNWDFWGFAVNFINACGALPVSHLAHCTPSILDVLMTVSANYMNVSAVLFLLILSVILFRDQCAI